MIEILKNSTGYKRLDVYALMNVIQLETLVFCRRHLDWKSDDPCGRQFDQMTQAARSGVKNLTEGCERGATSAQTMLKLLDVAKASLCELRDDYMTWLLDRNLPPWRQRSDEAQAVYKVLLDSAEYGDDINYDVAVRIIATRKRFAPWFDATQEGAVFANAMLILIGRSLNMLGALMTQAGEHFRVAGGFSERLTAARVEARRTAGEKTDDDAPKCPTCGADMRLRHGRSGDFWGCTAYPKCHGTREIDGSR